MSRLSVSAAFGTTVTQKCPDNDDAVLWKGCSVLTVDRMHFNLVINAGTKPNKFPEDMGKIGG